MHVECQVPGAAGPADGVAGGSAGGLEARPEEAAATGGPIAAAGGNVSFRSRGSQGG